MEKTEGNILIVPDPYIWYTRVMNIHLSIFAFT